MMNDDFSAYVAVPMSDAPSSSRKSSVRRSTRRNKHNDQDSGIWGVMGLLLLFLSGLVFFLASHCHHNKGSVGKQYHVRGSHCHKHHDNRFGDKESIKVFIDPLPPIHKQDKVMPLPAELALEPDEIPQKDYNDDELAFEAAMIHEEIAHEEAIMYEESWEEEDEEELEYDYEQSRDEELENVSDEESGSYYQEYDDDDDDYEEYLDDDDSVEEFLEEEMEVMVPAVEAERLEENAGN